MSSTFPISKIAWLDSWLTSCSLSPGLRISLVFVSAISSFTASACHIRTSLPQFPGGQFRFCGVVRNALCSSPMLPFCLLFQGARFVCARSGTLLLLLAIPILFQRYLGCRSWSFKTFEIYSISVLRGHTTNTVSRYCSGGHDCK